MKELYSDISFYRNKAVDLKKSINASHKEQWWQEYLEKHDFLGYKGYYNVISKYNISTGRTQIPDFLLLDTNNGVDVLEIKTPQASLLSYDKSRNLCFLSAEVMKAHSQVDRYIESLVKNSLSICNSIKETHDIDVNIIKPKGVILMGNLADLSDKDQSEFERLRKSFNNVAIWTFDELAIHFETMASIKEKQLQQQLEVIDNMHKTKLTQTGPVDDICFCI